jgi:hypothetical protein
LQHWQHLPRLKTKRMTKKRKRRRRLGWQPGRPRSRHRQQPPPPKLVVALASNAD